CGKVRRITVRLRTLEIPQELMQGNYEGDPSFRGAMQRWVQQLWQEKDARIQALLEEAKSG
ncbi:MAG TPA: hypothetical protein PKH25_07435, partial [Syntrophales bacterium]|nr:hypothetical protein [Syntrophales bacterium]